MSALRTFLDTIVATSLSPEITDTQEAENAARWAHAFWTRFAGYSEDVLVLSRFRSIIARLRRNEIFTEAQQEQLTMLDQQCGLRIAEIENRQRMERDMERALRRVSFLLPLIRQYANDGENALFAASPENETEAQDMDALIEDVFPELTPEQAAAFLEKKDFLHLISYLMTDGPLTPRLLTHDVE